MFGSYVQAADPRYVALAYDERGKIAGFTVAFPDPSPAFRSATGTPPGSTPPDRARDRDGFKRIIFYMIGASPEARARRLGLGQAIHWFTMRRLLDDGYDRVIYALMADARRSTRLIGQWANMAQREHVLYGLDV